MKTPMQELIEQLKRLKYSEMNEQAWDAYDLVMDIAESLLEKEKEVMNKAWDEAADCLEEFKTFEEYYNETFKTKEK